VQCGDGQAHALLRLRPRRASDADQPPLRERAANRQVSAQAAFARVAAVAAQRAITKTAAEPESIAEVGVVRARPLRISRVRAYSKRGGYCHDLNHFLCNHKLLEYRPRRPCRR